MQHVWINTTNWLLLFQSELWSDIKIEQSGQITGSGTVVPDLVIFSFVLPFIVFGDLIKFLETNSSQIFIKHVMKYNLNVSF